MLPSRPSSLREMRMRPPGASGVAGRIEIALAPSAETLHGPPIGQEPSSSRTGRRDSAPSALFAAPRASA
jgi:hypothetical protein